jgi:hypothetical protein
MPFTAAFVKLGHWSITQIIEFNHNNARLGCNFNDFAMSQEDFRVNSCFLDLLFMRNALSVSAFFLSLSIPMGYAFAASPSVRDFIVPVDDGYGMDECMAEGGPCAKLIADSWCQVNGMKTSLHYVAAEASDVTASLSKKITDRLPAPSDIVTCSD